MVLHEQIRDSIEDDVYASVGLSVSMPKYRFPDSEQEPRNAYSVVNDELMLDGNSRQNLETFARPGRNPRSTSSWTSAWTRT